MMPWISPLKQTTVHGPTAKLVLFLTVGGLVGSAGLMAEVVLLRGGAPGFAILLLSNLITGAVAGTLFVQTKIREQERRQVAADRLSKIADMNHHVRNALAIVAFYGTQGGNPSAAQLVSQAVKRIEWTLREVLPRGWDLGASNSSSPVKVRPLREENVAARAYLAGSSRALKSES